METLHVSANEAFGKFKGKHLSSENVDFSDRLRPSTKKKGYIAWSGEFELAAQGESETPLQKYQRLNCEVRELLEELETAKKADRAKEGDLTNTAKKVSGLQEELAKLKLEEALGSEAIKDLQDPSNAANAKLMAHLERLKKGPKKADGSAKSTDATKGDQVTYELMMKPEASKLEAKEMVAKFDKRLEALEKALGATPEALV